MKNIFRINTSYIRFGLELIALPFFIFLVIHLAGHGAMLLTDPNHSHEAHAEIHTEEMHENHAEHDHEEDHDAHEDDTHGVEIFSEEILFGVLFLLVFVWIWHRPFLKKWIPCQHEHCHEKHNWFHIAAIAAFCLHFFPEAEIRHQLLENFSFASFTSVASAIGFASHFFVDIIVAVTLSTAFHTPIQKVISLIVIVGLYVLSFLFEGELFHFIPSIGEGIILLISGFVLAMFVHMPHKPKKCGGCK